MDRQPGEQDAVRPGRAGRYVADNSRRPRVESKCTLRHMARFVSGTVIPACRSGVVESLEGTIPAVGPYTYSRFSFGSVACNCEACSISIITEMLQTKRKAAAPYAVRGITLSNRCRIVRWVGCKRDAHKHASCVLAVPDVKLSGYEWWLFQRKGQV
jgi:hypothetical protein